MKKVKTLNDLIGSQVTSIREVYVGGLFDYWLVEASNFRMNVYNKMLFSSCDELRKIRKNDLAMIADSIICGCSIEHDQVIIRFQNSNRLIISLLDKDYNGPEAALVHFDSGKILVV